MEDVCVQPLLFHAVRHMQEIRVHPWCLYMVARWGYKAQWLEYRLDSKSSGPYTRPKCHMDASTSDVGTDAWGRGESIYDIKDIQRLFRVLIESGSSSSTKDLLQKAGE